MKTEIANVVVDKATYSYDKEYAYLVPAHLKDLAQVGCRVLVGFGRGHQKRVGLITGFGNLNDLKTQKLKSIEAVLDKAPLFNDEMLSLIHWMKELTFCTAYEAAKAILPPGINLKKIKYYSLSQVADGCDLTQLSATSIQVLELLKKTQKPLHEKSISNRLQISEIAGHLEELEDKGLLQSHSEVKQKVGDLTQKMARLSEGIDREDFDSFKLTPKQSTLADILADVGTAAVKELCYLTGVTQSVVSALSKKKVIEVFEMPVMRSPAVKKSQGDFYNKKINLTAEQNKAYTELEALLESENFETSLLFGVTGSGKTLVYLKLIDRAISVGDGVIVMVPEIALTPQLLQIFKSRYGEKVAIFHSALPLGERADEWKRVKNGLAKIVVGTRSAVFAPLENIGLIIIDEEQESTYKSDMSPRYHTHDLARFRSAYHKALLLLASATPSIESYTAALQGKYKLSVLNERYGKAQLPEVITVDMRQELIEGQTSEISSVLRSALEENLENGFQSILMINRRGYNTLATCTACGSVVTCPHCSISLRYHSANNRLMCHYCGYSKPFSNTCDECQKQSIRYTGFGTQKIEEELKKILPGARIMRMDTDSTMTRYSHENKLDDFRQKKFDIMLGTQMVAKGLDFENVTLVGVVSIDQQLYNDDFRSMESTFSLLTQVVGRSGRGKHPGKAIIQTFAPSNDVINLAAKQDYEAFYEKEIEIRRLLIYPPYCDLCQVSLSSTDEALSKTSADEFLKILKSLSVKKYPEQKIIVLGPVQARIAKISNKYRYRLIIKCKNTRTFRQMVSDAVIEFAGLNKYKRVTLHVDINPSGIV